MRTVYGGKIQPSFSSLLITLALVVSFAAPARADRKSDAREQFERAVSLRTQLEGYLPKDRSLANYKQTVNAFHKVYLISTQAEEVTPSFIAQAEIYCEMGKQFDPKYFQSAIDSYNFLLKQYPGSRYRGDALFAIAEIQKDDLREPDAAETTLKDYLKRFPRSEKSAAARQELAAIAADRNKPQENVAVQQSPAASATLAQASQIPPTGDDAITKPVSSKPIIKRNPDLPSRVTDIHTWNAADHTRIVVALDDAVQYDAVRLHSPDRIYFDLYKAQLDGALLGKTISVDNGLLKSVRVAQNKQGVVRLVLDVSGAKDFSAFQLQSPNRLVIDVQTQSAASNSANASPVPTASISATAKSPTASADTKPAPLERASAANLIPSASKPAVKIPTAKLKAEAQSATVAALRAPTEPKPTHDGQIPLTRALGLKISRIVIDAGHGGHDTGTIGPHGLMEKDLCLDVALRLGKEIEEKLPGAQVIYTRRDDTFVPLEERTAIANLAKADLFISIHANSSHDHAARGVETYYLNFATSEESMEVAARENALSQESLHDLQTLIQKIARNEKIEESKELAGDIQDSLTQRLQLVSQSERNRGVKKAPFVVLIGANMPSILSEISFISNPNDERLLKRGDQRQRVADGLYRGISSYLDNLNSLSIDRAKITPETHIALPTTAATVVAPDGNQK
ncbi:MAG: N-acetylmuramoyl-L-alanine amidase [Candidatus Acidiferrales bacterium]